MEGDDEEEMEGNRRDEEEMQDSLVVEVGILVPLPLSPSPAAHDSRFFFQRKS